MEGVTILSTTTVAIGIPLWVGILIALLVGVLWGLIMFGISDEPILGVISGALAAILITIAFVVTGSFSNQEETHYKVILDDSVQYVEFTEKYEVIDQEGEIYTIRERIKE